NTDRIVLPDGPASTRGRQHLTAGIFGGMPAGTRPGTPPQCCAAAPGSGTRGPEHRIRTLRTPAATGRVTYRWSRTCAGTAGHVTERYHELRLPVQPGQLVACHEHGTTLRISATSMGPPDCQ